MYVGNTNTTTTTATQTTYTWTVPAGVTNISYVVIGAGAGGGGGATYTVSSVTQTSGAYANYGTTGAVRIIWPGNTRQFPSTNVYVQNSSGTWV